MESNIVSTEELNKFCRNTLVDHLGIEFLEVLPGRLKARMPVDCRTIQPMGLVHGGAILALAETIGSAGSYTLIDNKHFFAVGMEVNGNHIGNTQSAWVIATAEILHQGRNTHVWDIRVFDDQNKPLSICRVTNMIIERREDDTRQ